MSTTTTSVPAIGPTVQPPTYGEPHDMSVPPASSQPGQAESALSGNPDLLGSPESRTMDAIKSRVLDNRGVRHPEVYSPKNLINPNGLMDGHKAGMRIAAALIRRQRIALVADFDCDSATGAALMKKGLNLISETLALAGRPKSTANPVSPDSVSDIQIVVPDRQTHGHGLTPSLATEVIHDIKANLIIALGTGSNAQPAAALIRQWQDAPDLIVLDHHAPAGTAPDTYALVSPNRSDCLFESKAIHSTGLAFYMLMLVRRCMVELIGGTLRGTAMADRICAVPMNHLSDDRIRTCDYCLRRAGILHGEMRW